MLVQLLVALLLIAIPNNCAHDFITSPLCTPPRIKLRDGRYLAYREYGVPKKEAKFIIVVVHGYDSNKDETFPASQELVEELGICFISYDRAGYGESDPNPKKTVKSESIDIDELANQLDLGSKFYLIGISAGGYAAYSGLKYIPHRLNGVVLLVPVTNYWWPSLPANVSSSAFNKLDLQYQNTFWVAHNLPFLFCGWMKQNLFGSSLDITESLVQGTTYKLDSEISEQQEIPVYDMSDEVKKNSAQQGVYESLCRDLMVLYSDWGFDPLQMENPFQNTEGYSVHLWANAEDPVCPVEIQRHVAKKLPWVRYHETPHGGHTFYENDGWGDKIVRALLVAEDDM